jgi:hypothetical protein
MHISGAPWNGATRRCYIETSHSGDLFVGDPVVLTGSADASGCYPTIGIATGGGVVFGVITSFEELPTNLGKTYFASGDTGGRFCNVCCDPTVLYEVQGNSAAAITADNVGANGDLVATAGGSTVTGYSGWELAQATITTTSTLQVRIMGASPRVDNDISSVYAKWLVLINKNQLFGVASNASAGTTYIGALGV